MDTTAATQPTVASSCPLPRSRSTPRLIGQQQRLNTAGFAQEHQHVAAGSVSGLGVGAQRGVLFGASLWRAEIDAEVDKLRIRVPTASANRRL